MQLKKLVEGYAPDQFPHGRAYRELLFPVINGTYYTKEFGQALRYGQYAVVSVCTNIGRAAKETEAQAVELFLSQWTDFEKWTEKLASNAKYKSNSSFEYDNYYKGSTINADLQNYSFKV